MESPSDEFRRWIMLSSSDAEEDQVGPTLATTGGAVGFGETFVVEII